MKEKGPEDKKPPAKNRPLERPSLINLNNELKVYKESGSENDNEEETEREKNLNKTQRIAYIKIDSDDDKRHENNKQRIQQKATKLKLKEKLVQ